MLNKETFPKKKDLIKTCNFEQDFRFLHGCVIVMPLFSETGGGGGAGGIWDWVELQWNKLEASQGLKCH